MIILIYIWNSRSKFDFINNLYQLKIKNSIPELYLNIEHGVEIKNVFKMYKLISILSYCIKLLKGATYYYLLSRVEFVCKL